MLFIESSALVKRYIRETGTSWLATRCAADGELAIAQVTPVEITAALARGLRRDPERLAAAIGAAELDLRHLLEVYLSDEITALARRLARTYYLRGYDAVQLATAVWLHNDLARTGAGGLAALISADAEINAAAVREGLAVENPSDHPEPNDLP